MSQPVSLASLFEAAEQAAVAGDFSGMQQAGSFIAHPPFGKWLIALGENDTLATPNGERDYMRSQVPTFLTVMDGELAVLVVRREGSGVRHYVGSRSSRSLRPSSFIFTSL